MAENTEFSTYRIRRELVSTKNLQSAMLIEHETGIIYKSEQSYSEGNDQGLTVSIWADPDSPKPKPLWLQEAVDSNTPKFTMTKVEFLPVPGIMVNTLNGFVFCWIEDEITYTLIVENTESISQALGLVESLEKIN